VLKRSQPVRGNFTTPSFALPYGGNTSTVKMPVFFSRAMSPSVCSQEALRVGHRRHTVVL
jgi:hypothetical protein